MFPSRKPAAVVQLVAGLLLAQWVLLQISLRTWLPYSLVETFWLGNDFQYLFNGAGNYLSGKSPYLEPNFIPLPPALYVPMVLHPLGYWGAFTGFRTIGFLLAVTAMVWLCRELQLSLITTGCILAVVITYGPFYSVLAGGNLDALMMALLVFCCVRSERWRGVVLGLSIGTKFYSLLLVGVLAARRRWREIGWAAGSLAVLLLPFAPYAHDAFTSVFRRTSVIRVDANESPAMLFLLLFGQGHPLAWKAAYVLLWGGTLVAKLLRDAKRWRDPELERFRVLTYVPWMASAPLLVFTYTATILLPLLPLLAKTAEDRPLKVPEWLVALGFVMTGLYAPLYGRLLQAALSARGVQTVAHAVPPLALAVMICGAGWAEWLEGSGKPRFSDRSQAAVKLGNA